MQSAQRDEEEPDNRPSASAADFGRQRRRQRLRRRRRRLRRSRRRGRALRCRAGTLRRLGSVVGHHRLTADHPVGVADHQRARCHGVGDAVLLGDVAAVSGRGGRRDQFRSVADPHTVVAVLAGRALADRHPRVRRAAEGDRGIRCAHRALESTKPSASVVGSAAANGAPTANSVQHAAAATAIRRVPRQVRGHKPQRQHGRRYRTHPRRATTQSLAS